MFILFLKKLRNNKGMSEFIQFGVTFIIFFYFMAATLDVIFLTMQWIGGSYAVASYNDVFALQGGLIGGSSPYASTKFSKEATNQKVVDKVSGLLLQFGVPRDKWKLDVNGTTIYNTGTATNLGVVNRKTYGNTGNLKLTITYHWRFIDRIIPNSVPFVLNINKTFVSELY